MKSVDGPWKIICKPYAALWGKQECLDLCHIYSNQAAFLLLSAKGSDSLSQCRIVAFFFFLFSVALVTSFYCSDVEWNRYKISKIMFLFFSAVLFPNILNIPFLSSRIHRRADGSRGRSLV